MSDPVLAASEASPDEADRLVGALPPDSQEAVVEAWLEAEDAERLRAIVDGTTCVASTRKLARKAIHLLKTRGVAIPESAKPTGPIPLAGRAEEPRAWLSGVDGGGYQVFVLAYGVPGGGYRGALGVRGGPEGLHEAVPFECAKKRLKDLVENASAQLGGRIVATDPAYVRWRLDRSIQKGHASGAAAADRVGAVVRKWPPPPDSAPKHPVRALALPPSKHVGAQPFAEADAVLSMPELRAWMPPPKVLEALGEALRGLDHSLVVVSPEASAERYMDAVLDAVASYFTEGVRKDLALDLEDTALVVAADDSRGEDVAAMLRAAADARDFAQAPAEVGILRLYFERCVPPPPTGKPEAPPPPKRSKGGIILP